MRARVTVNDSKISLLQGLHQLGIKGHNLSNRAGKKGVCQ